MRLETAGVGTIGRLVVRSAERESFTEYYLLGSAAEGTTAREAAEPAFARAAAVLTEKGIQPISEKIYGAAPARDPILALRAGAYRRHGVDPALPCTFVEGRPPDGGSFAGVQIWGIAPRARGERTVATVARAGAPAARCWTWQGCRLLHVPFVRGTAPDGTLAAGRAAQAEQMFQNAGAALAAHGFGWAQVVRTWIYFAHLLDWYGEFNQVRTAYYRRAGLGSDTPGAVFPASTGIQGRSLGEECFLDLLAVDTTACHHVTVHPLRKSARQEQAFRYGSAFSRGMAVELEGRKTVYVSGTASIDAQGATRHVGDAGAQGLDTLLSVAALLEEEGGGLEDICTATLYCKDREAFRAVQEALRLLRVPPVPWVCVLADVCRPELLVELDAVAVV